MCTTYEINYLRCQREVGRDCKHTDHLPCDSGMCKGDDHQHVTVKKDENCPVHGMDKGQGPKAGGFKDRKMEEWPDTDCRPL
ncbi:hypothetical protein OPT61_g9272 [Boeremia exigua]|uniref:Uncharacterized protein n=1 Tax=Boeremia exigua TaxID=749465 RepID=A0ACC2HUS0_9PLEO|nr:hypothetical protein OPT61_g9272 [Boeremia exigua]